MGAANSNGESLSEERHLRTSQLVGFGLKLKRL